MSTPGSSRDRPSRRFEGLEKKLSLPDAIARLRSEGDPGPSGHRQISLMREGPVSLILFSFDAGGQLKEHRADGIVCIHVLRGRLQVRTADQEHELGTSELLFLSPQVPHGLVAIDEADVLVSIQAASTA